MTLPPLHSIRAFEAAGRLLSFSDAAKELYVTQGAISRQITVLEKFLGTRLFQRGNRGVELTKAGQVYLAAVERGLYEISSSTGLLTGSSAHRAVTVSTFPTLSFMWLMPCLAAFASKHPSIQIRVLSNDPPAELQPNRIDMKISLGQLPGKTYRKDQPRIGYEITSNWNRMRFDFLFEEWLVAVVSRQLNKAKPIQKMRHLEHHTLIHTAARPYAWPDWARANGAPALKVKQNTHVAHLFTALHLARSGAGVALIPATTFYNFDAREELLRVLPSRIPSAGEYYVVTREQDNNWTELQVFREWLLAEGRAMYQQAMDYAKLPTHRAAAQDRSGTGYQAAS
jgi:LysR family transcriptional regulator, glycine cleavage system transcriptional activator